VLIIDDHAVTRTVIAETIQALGWLTVAVENSAQAIQHMTAPTSNTTAIDLLLLMMRLPDTEYLGTIHAIEKHLPAHHPLKTILITSHFDPRLSKEIEPQITIGILDRPFTPVDLFDAVATLFNVNEIGQIDQKPAIEDAKKTIYRHSYPGCRRQ
jgi:CheY-like chemotaxis protein